MMRKIVLTISSLSMLCALVLLVFSFSHVSANPMDNEAKVDDLQQTIEDYVSSGDINSIFSEQLIYRLQIIETLIDQDSVQQAAAFLEDFITFTRDQTVLLQGLISQEAIDEISYRVTDRIQALSNPNELQIVDNGVGNAVVLTPSSPTNEESETAQLLVEYIYRSTGITLPMMSEDELREAGGVLLNRVRIYTGTAVSSGDQHLAAMLQGLDNSGFVIHPHGNSLTILGPSVWGTRNGVIDFLENVVGVRWLMPGPDGEDVPLNTSLSVSRADVREEPVFMQRVVSPLSGDPKDASQSEVSQAYFEWAQMNRLQGTYNRPINFHHNLYSLFPVSTYGATNPEFYPNGKPPAAGVTAGWQPCFTSSGTVEAAVTGILAFFQNNPQATSFSLGVNDSRGFCEANPNHPAYPNKTNSLGLADLSNIYYQWVNEVVEQVTQVYPDKWFGLLAYQNVADAPSFPLHSRVVPFITQDRMTWLDPEIKLNSQERIEQWSEMATQIGLYDYMYGSHYVLPRVYPQLMGETYNYAQHQSVAAHYAEMYPSGIDGPKAWVSAKLQWNPNQDTEVLLQQWYERAVGPEAAPYLQQYYEQWEQFWTERIPNSAWFQQGKSKTFLPFTSGSYLDLVTDEDLNAAREMMVAVVLHAGTEAQQTRAAKLFKAFEFVEASIISYPKQIESPTNSAEAMTTLNEIIDTLTIKLQMADKRDQLIEEFKNDPMLALSFVPNVEASGWNKNSFWGLVDYLKQQEPYGGQVTDRLVELSILDTSSPESEFARLVQKAAGNGESQTANASFEEGTGITPWRMWLVSSGSYRRATELSYTGGGSLLLKGFERGGPYQTFQVEPGLASARVNYYVPAGTETEGTIQLRISIRGANGTDLSVISSELRPLSETIGEWASISLLEDIPETINGQAVTQIQFLIIADSLGAGNLLYLDDAVVIKNEPKWNEKSFWNLVDYLQQHEPLGGSVTDHVEQLAVSPTSSPDSEFASYVLKAVSGTDSLTVNSSFEVGTGISPWSIWAASGAGGSYRRATEIAHTGNGSLLLKGFGRGGPYQTVQVQPGQLAAKVNYYVPDGTVTEGTIQLRMTMRAADGTNLIVIETERRTLSETTGQWATIRLFENIPETIEGKEVTQIQFLIIASNLGAGNLLYLDDAIVLQKEF
jgi:hypothetical protein